MAIINTETRKALLEVATKLQIQTGVNGAVLPDGESVSVDVAGDGKSVAISATLTGTLSVDSSGQPVFVPATADTPGDFVA